jgi:hypothetical protein
MIKRPFCQKKSSEKERGNATNSDFGSPEQNFATRAADLGSASCPV